MDKIKADNNERAPEPGFWKIIVEGGNIRALDSAGKRYRLRPEIGIPVNASAATLSTSLTGTNNDLDFTAVTAGLAGNLITIAYVNPGAETASESVSVSGTAITVTLRSVSSTLSTAAQVKAAIEANAEADALVSVANKSGNDGSGVVTAMTATALAGGVNATEAMAGDQMIDQQNRLIYTAMTDMTVSTTSGWEFVSTTP